MKVLRALFYRWLHQLSRIWEGHRALTIYVNGSISVVGCDCGIEFHNDGRYVPHDEFMRVYWEARGWQ